MKKYMLMLLLFVCLFLVGCDDKNSIVGTWSGVSDDSLSMNVTFSFKSSSKGDCSYKNSYFETKGTCIIEGDTITMEMEDWSNPKVYKFVINDGKLSMTANDSYSPNYKDLVKE